MRALILALARSGPAAVRGIEVDPKERVRLVRGLPIGGIETLTKRLVARAERRQQGHPGADEAGRGEVEPPPGEHRVRREAAGAPTPGRRWRDALGYGALRSRGSGRRGRCRPGGAVCRGGHRRRRRRGEGARVGAWPGRTAPRPSPSLAPPTWASGGRRGAPGAAGVWLLAPSPVRGAGQDGTRRRGRQVVAAVATHSRAAQAARPMARPERRRAELAGQGARIATRPTTGAASRRAIGRDGDRPDRHPFCAGFCPPLRP